MLIRNGNFLELISGCITIMIEMQYLFRLTSYQPCILFSDFTIGFVKNVAGVVEVENEKQHIFLTYLRKFGNI